LKKFEKISGEQVLSVYLKALKLMDEVEDMFAWHFAGDNRCKAMKYLKPAQRKESHSVIFFTGLMTGCFAALFMATASWRTWNVGGSRLLFLFLYAVIRQEREVIAYCSMSIENEVLVCNAPYYFCYSSSSMEKVYTINSPLKKRKSQYELVDPRLLSLKYKFRNRLSRQEDDSATTESLGNDGIFMNKNSGTDMVSIPEELDSCEKTLSLLGGCIEVDSKNGIRGQSMRKMFEIRTSASSSSSNNFSSEAFSSSHSSGTRETDSWVMHDVEHDHSGLMLQPHDDLERMYSVLEQYDDLMKDELASGNVYGSGAYIMDEKLYSNGVDDFQILPTGQTGYHGEKKLTIDQEFEQYFSNLML
ncbi:hypothetical protein BAE44_0009535, partial [Dichanthelium oligosanthes]